MRPPSWSRVAAIGFPLLITAWLFANASIEHLRPDQEGSAPVVRGAALPSPGPSSSASSQPPSALLSFIQNELKIDPDDPLAVASLTKLLGSRTATKQAGEVEDEANPGLPSDSTVVCHLQNDGTDLCSYTNVCIDLPTDEWTNNRPPKLHLIERAESGGALKALADQKNPESWTYDFADVQDPLLFRPRVVPFALTRLAVGTIRPEEAVSTTGTTTTPAGPPPTLVTWSEDPAYLTMNVLHSHLWGWFASVGSPLFAAFFANVSSNLGLPPMRQVVVLADGPNQKLHSEAAWNSGTPYPRGGTDRWAREMLEELLAFFWSEHQGIFSGADSAVAAAGPAILQSAIFEPISAANGHVGTDAHILKKNGVQPPRRERKESDGYSGVSDASGKPQPGFVFGVDGYFNKDAVMEQGTAIVDHCFSTSPSAIAKDAEWLPQAVRDSLAEVKEEDAESIARLQSILCILQALFQGTGAGAGAGAGGTGSHNHYSDPRPHSLRTIYTARDQNFHPVQVAVMRAAKERLEKESNNKGSSGSVFSASTLQLLAAFKAGVDRAPHRMCFRRAVLIGQRDNMVSGFVEAAYWRRFAQLRLGISPDAVTKKWPPRKVLLLDRVLNPTPETSNTHKFARHFVNRAEVEAVIFKYGFARGFNYTLLTDDEIAGMSVKEQAQVFSQHGVVIVPHGATMTNFAFALSAHSSVIEINPFNIWCPIYQRLLVASGHNFFPLYSKQKSPYLDYSFTWKYTDQQALDFHKRCDALGPWKSAEDA